MARTHITGQSQKEFVRIFDSICAWNSRYERWCDVITLWAIEISCAIDRRPIIISQRQEEYRFILQKYSAKEREQIARLLAQMINDMEELPIQDYLGSMFMELNMGSDANGQFFTPNSIANLMAELAVQNVADAIKMNGWITINEPTCGGGATILAMAKALKDQGINYQNTVLFVGQDLDRRVALTCYVQMSLYGLPGWIRIGDTLADPPNHPALWPTDDVNIWYTPMFFSDVWNYRRLIKSVLETQND